MVGQLKWKGKKLRKLAEDLFETTEICLGLPRWKLYWEKTLHTWKRKFEKK